MRSEVHGTMNSQRPCDTPKIKPLVGLYTREQDFDKRVQVRNNRDPINVSRTANACRPENAVEDEP